MKWKAGDHFFFNQWPTTIYRVHRVHGSKIYYLGRQYGTNPPRGLIRTARACEMIATTKVQTNYCFGDDATFTHSGKRITLRGLCEKCGTRTNWIVPVIGRDAYWCGCD